MNRDRSRRMGNTEERLARAEATIERLHRLAKTYETWSGDAQGFNMVNALDVADHIREALK